MISIRNDNQRKLVPLVNEDAIELAQLAEQFWSLKPAVFQRKGPLVLCQFINECFSTENRFQATPFIVSSIANEYRNENHYARVLNSCINSRDMMTMTTTVIKNL